MRLIFTFASSLLFVPIVLAIDLVPWAGAFLRKGNEACPFRTGSYSFITGTFNVPLVWDDKPSGINIAVGIDGIAGLCDSNITFMAGIDAWLNNNVVSYKGWASWGTQVMLASNFDIRTGDFVRASVTVDSATTGSALLENLFTGQTWNQSFAADDPVVCQQSAVWTVTALDDYLAVGIPKFSTVTFVNATAKTASGATVTSGGATIMKMSYNNTMANGMADESIVVVACELYEGANRPT